MDETMVSQVSMYINIVLSVLFFVSEALPFINHNDYNGVFDLIHKRFFKCNAALQVAKAIDSDNSELPTISATADSEDQRMEFID